ncbi:MAG TPA: FAD/NAD(P)-binding protein [Azospirillaceae bacterium]|nr:FAD/NAD(P)-binding protein [Azospirillaceae bacterium]
MPRRSIAIVGAGFSGTLLAAHLLLAHRADIRIHLIERNPQFGRGLAYATGNANHLLNVRASRMSAFADRPDHFMEWLRANAPDGAPVPDGDSFVSRRLFGAYVQGLLAEILWGSGHAANLFLVNDAAVAVERKGARWLVRTEGGRPVTADAVVLAVGNFPPEPPYAEDNGVYASERFHPDPWGPDVFEGLAADAPVLLIGTGLTMVDTLVSLSDRGHAGPVHALSRRGLVPRRHLHTEAAPLPIAWPPSPSVARLLKEFRAHVRARGAHSWAESVDALRPVTQELWQAMPLPEQERFLRHLRPWWDVHRHRLAPKVADLVDGARLSERLVLHRGRILRLERAEGGVAVTWRARGAAETQRLEVERIINCSGPSCDYARIRDPLVMDLMAKGLIRPDPLKLGLDVDARDGLVGEDGRSTPGLFGVGPVTRARWWEVTAVPDIRVQSERLAHTLVGLFGP